MFLRKLRTLDLSFNQIEEINELDALIRLEKLDLRSNKIAEIKGLDELINLKELDLSENQIQAIKGISKLTSLEFLELQKNPLIAISYLKQLVWMPFLQKLYLFGIKENNDLNIPLEKFGDAPEVHNLEYGEYGNVLYPKDYKPRPKNCLPLVRSYFLALQQGITYNREVSLVLVGNTTVGKTSLRYFLKDKIFPPPQDSNCSTHGIEPDIWKVPLNTFRETPTDKGPSDVQIYIWDFGGQEYYHATHRLFLSKEAVYILVWDKNTDKTGHENIKLRLRKSDGSVAEVEQRVELFPYEYWLKTIRFFAPDYKKAPIVLVQNKLDESNYDRVYPRSELFDMYGKFDVHHLSLLDANNTMPDGLAYSEFERFQRHLMDLFKDRLIKTAREYYWEEIKYLLEEFKQYKKIWHPDELMLRINQITSHIDQRTFPSYLNSLSSNGFILYYADDAFLKDYIFIDPAWVTEIIYSILDESVLRNNGEFDVEHIERKMQNINNEYTTVFIALMKKFELIFENPETKQLIAPQYLPAQLSDKKQLIGTWNRLSVRFVSFANPSFHLRFPKFLPPSIMLRFLSFYGSEAIEQNYWKRGIAFLLEGKEVVVLADYEGCIFKIFVENDDKYVQRLVFDTLFTLTGSNETLELGINGHYINYTELRKYHKNAEVATVEGSLVQSETFRHFMTNLNILRDIFYKTVDKENNQIRIFISYAHEDEEIKNTLVNIHLKAIQNFYENNLVTWTDADIKAGYNWNEKIISEVKAADIILFLVSSNFLASDYIKNTEIKCALDRYKEGKQIIIPIYIEEVSKKILPFKDKQYLLGSKALESWVLKSKAWAIIQDEIITAIDDIKSGNIDHYFS